MRVKLIDDVYMKGECSIKTGACTAKTVDSIKAVLLSDQAQINVCHVCLDEKILAGEWVVEG